MPRLWPLSIALTVGCVLAGTASALELVRDGKSAATIVIAEFATAVEREAAETLQDMVHKISGARLPIVDELAAPDIAEVSVGHTQRAAAAGVDLEGLKYDGYQITVRDGTLFLIGRDADRHPLPHQGAKGTLRAVLGFLERICEVRWILPGPLGVYYEKTPTISVPDDLDVGHEPPFRLVVGRMYNHGIWSQANNYRDASRFWNAGGHSWSTFVPDELFETHPEYFTMRDGQRVLVGRPHDRMLCATNPQVIELMTAGIRKLFDAGYTHVQLGQSDGYIPCQCPRCEAMGNYPEGPCERILVPHAEVAQRCFESHPDHKVVMMVYGPTERPSEKINQWPANMTFEIAATRHQEQWTKLSSEASTRYAYLWGLYRPGGLGPSRTVKDCAQYIHECAETGVAGIYFCGGDYNWGLEGPSYYVAGRMLGDLSLDYRIALREYCDRLYGDAGDIMHTFYCKVDEVIEASYEVEHLPPREEHPELVFTSYWTPEKIAELQALLDQSKMLIGTEKRDRNWLALTENSLRYLADVANVFAVYRRYKQDESIDNLKALAKAVRTRNFNIENYLALANDGHYAFHYFPGAARVAKHAVNGGTLRHRLPAAPFTWDFDAMIAKDVLPSLSRVAAVARRIQAPPDLDGRLDDAAWQGLPDYEIGEVALGKLRSTTNFNVAYDDTSLYFAFRVKEPEIEKMTVSQFARDEKVWHTECIELFFDTEGLARRYQHFILTPSEGGYYDARKGYIDDPLHPLFTSEDPSWNPQWLYAYYIDKPNRQWTVEVAVPFAALGETAPAIGDKWRMNLARVRHFLKPKEWSLWSPNLQGRLFGDPVLFGDLYFGRQPND